MQLVFSRATNDCPSAHFTCLGPTRGRPNIKLLACGTPALVGATSTSPHLSQDFNSLSCPSTALLALCRLCCWRSRCSIDTPIQSTTTNIDTMANHKRSHSPSQSGPRTTAPDLEILADQVTLRPSGYVEPLEQHGGGDKERNLVEHMAKFRSSPLE